MYVLKQKNKDSIFFFQPGGQARSYCGKSGGEERSGLGHEGGAVGTRGTRNGQAV